MDLRYDITGPTRHPFLNGLPFPKQFENTIFYGPSGVGKYTQALRKLATYSKSNLKYTKRILVPYDGEDIPLKMSDVHVEVDLQMLGCSPRQLWNDIFTHVQDISAVKGIRIILCKNFQHINSDLLDVFHTYMQGNIKYFILTDAVSFIPSNISGRCRIVGIPHPAGHSLPFKRETAYGVRFAELLKSPPAPNLIREELYDWCIKGLVIDQVIWEMIQILQPTLNEKQERVLLETCVKFIQYYNNNYRPIYHLEYLTHSIICLLKWPPT
jgi:hypothetical protein